jgi:hypothetical protein
LHETTVISLLHQQYKSSTSKKAFYAVIDGVVFQNGLQAVLLCQEQLTCNTNVLIPFVRSALFRFSALFFCAVKTKKQPTQ